MEVSYQEICETCEELVPLKAFRTLQVILYKILEYLNIEGE